MPDTEECKKSAKSLKNLKSLMQIFVESAESAESAKQNLYKLSPKGTSYIKGNKVSKKGPS